MRLGIIIFMLLWCLLWCFLCAINAYKINFYVAITCYALNVYCSIIWIKRLLQYEPKN